MTAPENDGSVARLILNAWDRRDKPALPIDWLWWRVPVLPQAAFKRPGEINPAVRPVETVEFRRVTTRPFDHGRMWSIVFGRYDTTEILVEAVQI